MRKIFTLKRCVIFIVFVSVLNSFIESLGTDPNLTDCNNPRWCFWGYSFGCAMSMNETIQVVNQSPHSSYGVVLIPYERYVMGVYVESGFTERKIPLPTNH